MGRDNRRRNKKKIFDSYEPAGSPEALATPLEDLGLSEKTTGILRDGGVVTAKDLAKRRAGELYRIRYVGKREFLETAAALKKIGLAFRPDEPKEEKAEGDVAKPQGTQNAHKQQGGQNPRGGQKQEGKDNRKQQKPASVSQNKDGRQNDQKQKNAPVKNNRDKKNKQGEKQPDKSGRPKYDYKPYENVSLYELVYGKRERPVHEKPQKEQLTPDSIVKFCRQGKWGYKDWKGNVLIQPVYDNAYAFHEDRACVEKDGVLGFIDKKNELVIDYKYDSATSFAEGLAAVSIGEKSGYIDKDGNEVLPMEFDVATGFEGGKAIVRQDGRWGVLDRETLKVLWR